VPLSDLPESIQFIAFLLIFVLIGVYPAWKKTAAMIRKALQKAAKQEQADTIQMADDLFEPSIDQHLDAQLNDFEIFIIRRLAQNSKKGLSRRKINAALHLEPATLKTALNSLLRRGLIHMSVSYFFGIRYHLSATGHDYAIDQGFIPSLHVQ
jgi:DNA-binding MarR family transcriptional regulator